MKLKSIILTCALLLSPLTVLAGGGHDHGHGHSAEPAESTQSKAVAIATDRVAMLVSNGKIDASWKSVKATSAEVKANEWLVIFNNKKISEPSKTTLYIFLSITGEFLAANFTGN